jgi:DNA polymerase III subunit gamma/tau
MTTEIYKTCRPTKLEDVFGQAEAVEIITGWLASTPPVCPHAILLEGNSGVGKSTLAAIIAHALDPNDEYQEINCAEVRGIDSVREIQGQILYKAMSGSPRVYILDEVVQFPKTTQQAFLQLLEKTPEHVFFILCTSDTTGLLPTFLSRCARVKLEVIRSPYMKMILDNACGEFSIELDTKVRDAVIEKAEGNARKALQLLEVISNLESPIAQLACLSKEEIVQKGDWIGSLIMKRAAWPQFQKSIASIEHSDLEGVRLGVLGHANKIMLSGAPETTKKMAYLMISAFRDDWFRCGKAGLVAACWECSHFKAPE